MGIRISTVIIVIERVKVRKIGKENIIWKVGVKTTSDMKSKIKY